jgi:hypothetical protein
MTNAECSPVAQKNLDTLVFLLQCRLQSKCKAKGLDDVGNIVYVDCDIYSKDMLQSFIALSVSDFNQVPYFTFFTLEDDKFVECFTEVLVEGATLYALSSQALIERGREFQITDGGIDFAPPTISEMLNTQFSTLLAHHWEKLKTIKASFSEYNLEEFKKSKK